MKNDKIKVDLGKALAELDVPKAEDYNEDEIHQEETPQEFKPIM